MGLEPGTEAPDFELKDQTGKPVRLSDYRGKKSVVLVFHPSAFAGLCTGELRDIRDDLTPFRNDDVETLAISVDAPPTNRAWSEQEGFEFPLLSDFWPHGAVAARYGVFNEILGVAERGTFVVDTGGVIRFAAHDGIPQARDLAAVRQALADLLT